MLPPFKSELAGLLNTHGFDAATGTPDSVLADLVASCLHSYMDAMRQRDATRAEFERVTGMTTTGYGNTVSVEQGECPFGHDPCEVDGCTAAEGADH